MKITIVDIQHKKYEPVLKHSGRSGKQYPFRWERTLGRYAYEAQDQSEVDDLFEGVLHFGGMYYLSVVIPPDPAPAPPAPERKRPAKNKP